MLSRKSVQGLDALRTELGTSGGDQPVKFVYFIGDRNVETKQSWCPDCVSSDPVIEEAASSAKPKQASVLVTCEVGDKTFWKDQSNGFRTSEDLKVTSIPTLLRYGTDKRLVDECKDAAKVKAFLED